MYTYPDSIGYINNKKCFSSISSTDGTVTYMLSTRTCSTGKELIINTTKRVGDSQLKSQTYIPILPYRIIFNDPQFFYYGAKSKLLPYYNILNLYNPGITSTSDNISMPVEFNSNNTKFIEFNIPRSCLNAFQGSYNFQKISSTSVFVNISKLTAYDIQASMVVEKVDDNNDNLILTVNSRVNIDLSYSDEIETKKNEWYYTIPVTVLLKINRTQLTTNNPTTIELVPFSWSYPIDPRWTNNFELSTQESIISIGKINSSIVGDFEDKMWNYNIIPGKYLSSTKGNYNYRFALNSFGCLTDNDYIDIPSGVITVTSLGNYSTGHKTFEQFVTVNNTLLTNAGYNPSRFYKNFTITNIASKVSIYKNGEYFVSVINCFNNSKREIYLTIYGFSDGLVMVSQILIGSDVYYGDLVERQGSLYFTYTSNTARYIFKFPTLSSLIISSLGFKFLSGLGTKDLLLSVGATLISSENVPYKAMTYSVYNLFMPDSTKLIYYIDDYCQDKSIGFLDKNYKSDDFNLNTYNNSILLLDKISMLETGQTNSIQQFKV